MSVAPHARLNSATYSRIRSCAAAGWSQFSIHVLRPTTANGRRNPRVSLAAASRVPTTLGRDPSGLAATPQWEHFPPRDGYLRSAYNDAIVRLRLDGVVSWCNPVAEDCAGDSTCAQSFLANPTGSTRGTVIDKLVTAADMQGTIGAVKTPQAFEVGATRHGTTFTWAPWRLPSVFRCLPGRPPWFRASCARKRGIAAPSLRRRRQTR